MRHDTIIKLFGLSFVTIVDGAAERQKKSEITAMGMRIVPSGLLVGIALLWISSTWQMDQLMANAYFGLLTGIISGSFLAIVTTYCQQRVEAPAQKHMLLSWCRYIEGLLQQFEINFILAKKYELKFDELLPWLQCMEGSGI